MILRKNRLLTCGAACLSVLPTLATAQSTRASAQASVQITTPVGASVAYNVLTDMLTGILVIGTSGDAVSLRSGDSSRNEMTLTTVQGTVSDDRIVSSVAHSGQLAQSAHAGIEDEPAGTNLLILAQFN